MGTHWLRFVICIATYKIHNSQSIHYLEFSNQKELPEVQATNYAILNGGSTRKQSVRNFTICGTIFIGYLRGRQAFYTMRQNGTDVLWLSLSLTNSKDLSDGYDAYFNIIGGSSYNIRKVALRPHGWSHACTSVDTSGHVLVVINGVLTHDVNTTLQSPGHIFTKFEDNLVLGVSWTQFSRLETYQSEASVTNVNIFSEQLSLAKMKHITTSGQ